MNQTTIPVWSLLSSTELLHFTTSSTGAWLLVARELCLFSILLLQHLKLKKWTTWLSGWISSKTCVLLLQHQQAIPSCYSNLVCAWIFLRHRKADLIGNYPSEHKASKTANSCNFFQKPILLYCKWNSKQIEQNYLNSCDLNLGFPFRFNHLSFLILYWRAQSSVSLYVSKHI